MVGSVETDACCCQKENRAGTGESEGEDRGIGGTSDERQWGCQEVGGEEEAEAEADASKESTQDVE